MVAATPFNKHKAAEHGAQQDVPEGEHLEPQVPAATGSTLSEGNSSRKTGDAEIGFGYNPLTGTLNVLAMSASTTAATTGRYSADALARLMQRALT